MKEFIFKKTDAFATVNSTGNPAGFIALDSFSDITESEMLQIAKELKGFVSEVGYLAPIKGNEFKLKYYSSEKEVDFCGHATIAIMYELIKNDKELLKYKSIRINTNRGVLNVENRLKEEDAVFIEAPKPVVRQEVPGIDKIIESLNISISDINPNLPVSVINAGLTTLIIPVNNLNSILSVNPTQAILKNFSLQSEIDIIEVFTDKVYNKTNDYRTRVFAPTFGYLEDPATGSGNSAFGYYLLNNKLWKNKDFLTIEQNASREQYNIIKLKKIKDRTGNYIVLFGGGAMTRIEGKYKIQ